MDGERKPHCWFWLPHKWSEWVDHEGGVSRMTAWYADGNAPIVHETAYGPYRQRECRRCGRRELDRDPLRAAVGAEQEPR